MLPRHLFRRDNTRSSECARYTEVGWMARSGQEKYVVAYEYVHTLGGQRSDRVLRRYHLASYCDGEYLFLHSSDKREHIQFQLLPHNVRRHFIANIMYT
jgi:hypothetical protein